MVTCTVAVALHPAFVGAVPRRPSRPVCSRFPRSNLRALLAPTSFLSLLCFHTLTNSFPRSSFLLTLIQIAGGCHPVAQQLYEPKLEPRLAISNPINNSPRCFPPSPWAGFLRRTPFGRLRTNSVRQGERKVSSRPAVIQRLAGLKCSA